MRVGTLELVTLVSRTYCVNDISLQSQFLSSYLNSVCARLSGLPLKYCGDFVRALEAFGYQTQLVAIINGINMVCC